MAIPLGSSFNVTSNVPLDSRAFVADTTARDAIVAGVRYEGMIVYSIADATNFQLVGGIANGNWVELSGGGGGGGGALQWVASDSNAPTQVEENLTSVFKYQAALAQIEYAAVRVPSSYKAGKQIFMKVTSYSPDVSGTNLLQTFCALIRTGTDAITSLTNQHTSTNAAINLATAALANKLNSHICDLTDAVGLINGVAVSPGDLLVTAVTRGTDTGVSDIAALLFGAEVTFNG